jgi:hypothetical protein
VIRATEEHLAALLEVAAAATRDALLAVSLTDHRALIVAQLLETGYIREFPRTLRPTKEGQPIYALTYKGRLFVDRIVAELRQEI